ncbi:MULTISPECIES: hypothetical protein [Stenotrophomonas]|jgi:hypothetical protein|nr:MULTISPECIES: hypothetical protein [unclassified Stenotrophomonas]
MVHYRQGGEKNSIGWTQRELMVRVGHHAIIAGHPRFRMRIE